MVTRTFRTSDGRTTASVTAQGEPRHRVRVVINGEEVEFEAGDRDDGSGAASFPGDRRRAGTASVSVQVTSTSVTHAGATAGASGSATSVHVSSSSRTARHGGPGDPPAGGSRNR